MDTTTALPSRSLTPLEGRPMSLTYPTTLTLLAAVGAGLAGGVFFAFSTFVMPGLGRADDRSGLVAMQGINKAAPTPVFMALLFGTALACALLAISAVRRFDQPVARWQLAGCLLYLLMIVVTAAYHVPHNDALALVDPDAAGAGATWRHYLSSWTAWNHLRTLACAGSAVALTIAARIA
jgi:uncharacterized membrane protein